eukprot:COSAG01_NODE_9283_length_2495_cov_1.633973_4_plen_96_part_00
MSEFYDLTRDPRELKNLWNDPSVAAQQQKMLDGLLKWYQETTDVAPLAEDEVGYPVNHTTPPDGTEEWWQRFNPVLHPILQRVTVDGHLIGSWLE